MALSKRCLCLTKEFAKLSLNYTTPAYRLYLPKPIKQRYPEWFVHKQRVLHDDFITSENKKFINEIVQSELQETSVRNNEVTYENSPLKDAIPNYGVWTPKTKRCGLIAKKIGDYPMWTKNGTRLNTTLLQVMDNQVVKYIPPEEWNPNIKRVQLIKNRLGCLLVGAENADPSLLTKEYYGIFKHTGVLPKKHLCRFPISPEAALPPGMPLTVSHYRVGDIVDIRGKTIYYGFQGVMKRWGFSGMPATHGVTKTHRRPGNIGGGGEKGRVWPGTKLPGHMGHRWRILRGVRILRINHEHNVMWVHGLSIPGPTNSLCYIYDTLLPLKKFQTSPPFPTHISVGEEPEESFLDELHRFNSPSIVYPE